MPSSSLLTFRLFNDHLVLIYQIKFLPLMNPSDVKSTCSAQEKLPVFHLCPTTESFRPHILMHEIHSLLPFPCPPRFPLRSWFPVNRLFRICRFFPLLTSSFSKYYLPPSIIVRSIYCLDISYSKFTNRRIYFTISVSALLMLLEILPQNRQTLIP